MLTRAAWPVQRKSNLVPDNDMSNGQVFWADVPLFAQRAGFTHPEDTCLIDAVGACCDCSPLCTRDRLLTDSLRRPPSALACCCSPVAERPVPAATRDEELLQVLRHAV